MAGLGRSSSGGDSIEAQQHARLAYAKVMLRAPQVPEGVDADLAEVGARISKPDRSAVEEVLDNGVSGVVRMDFEQFGMKQAELESAAEALEQKLDAGRRRRARMARSN